MSSANRHSLTTSFPTCIPFIYSSYLTALARNSTLSFVRVERVGILVLFLTLEGMFSVFLMYYDVDYRFVICSLYCVEVHSFYSLFHQSFYPERMWFLSLLLWICYIAFNDLRMLNNPCLPRMKPTWSWCMIFLICCWIWFSIILLRIFILLLIRGIGL
jgi:hypothetical protein